MEESTTNFTLKVPALTASKLIEFLVKEGIPFNVSYLTDIKTTQVNSITSSNSSEVGSLVHSNQKQRLTIDDMEAVCQEYLKSEVVDSPLREIDIAHQFGQSLGQFRKEFKEKYGKPFYQYYMEQRMAYATKLLREGYKANQVSRMIGYGEKSVIKFNKMFQKHYGITPKKYQLTHAPRTKGSRTH